MDDMQSILARILKKRGLYGHAEAAQVTHIALRELHKALPELAESLSIGSCKDGTLTIIAANSIASQEAQQCKDTLMNAILRDCPNAPIREIRIVRGQ